MEFDNTDELLDFVSDGGVARTHAQGYEWFWNTLQPALAVAQPASSEETERLADCHYVCGDVHDFNNAPLAAIEEYRKSIALDPENGSPYREIANMQMRMGDLVNARISSDLALELAPDDKHALSDREELNELIKNPLDVPLYKKGDKEWMAFELLAEFEPLKALQCASSHAAATEMRALPCCLGALEYHDDYLKYWRRIVSTDDSICFTHADWFFMPTDVYMEADLWRILLDSKAQFNGVFTVFDGLEESERYKALSTNEKIRLRLDYYVCAQSFDTTGLKRIHRDYPEWKELSETLAEDE